MLKRITITPKQALELQRRWCISDFGTFLRLGFHIVEPSNEYQHNWHIDAITEYLKAVHSGEIRRLIINMPPRSLKSNIVSVFFPAWLLGLNPSAKIIVGSFAKSLSIKHSVDCRLLVQSKFYQDIFPDTRITADQNEKSKFQTTKRGHRISCSVGSAIVGEGGDHLIVDDPVDPINALSEAVRETANMWHDQTLISRQNDKKKSSITIVMQRLHTKDLTGHLLEQGGWEHLKLPSYFNKKTIIQIGDWKHTAEEGEYLHKEREGKEEMKQLEREMGAYAYAGQYMQEPVPVGGGEFKAEWVQYYHGKLSVKSMNIYILVDPANEKKKESDYTALMVVGLNNDKNYYLLDIVRDKMNPTERVNELFRLHEKWNYLSGKPPKVGYEKYGMMTDTHFIKLKQKTDGYHFPLVELGGKMSKNDRIRQLIPLMETERLFFPPFIEYTDYSGKEYDLVEQLIKGEMLTFPVGMHPDMLDALARIVDPDLNAIFPKLRNKHYRAPLHNTIDNSQRQPNNWVNM